LNQKGSVAKKVYNFGDNAVAELSCAVLWTSVVGVMSQNVRLSTPVET